VLPALILTLVGWGAVYVALSWDRLESMLFLRQPWDAWSPRRVSAAGPLTIPTEIAWRARAMFSAGRLRDALQAVAAIQPADPLRGEADRLSSEIQRALLTGGAPSATLGLTPGPPAPAAETRPVVRNE
jgi:hypothetical protein